MVNCSAAANLRQVKRAIRDGYAWPGGYPLYVVMADGEALSCAAAHQHWRAIVWSTLHGAREGWAVAGAAINWEDGALYCCHSGARIASAYAEAE